MNTHPRPVKIAAIGPIVDPSKKQPKAALDVRGMFGIGDCLFQRAILRDLMQRYDSIILDSYYKDMFWDLEREGLRLNIVRDKGRIRDSDNRSDRKGVVPSHQVRKIEQVRLTYDRTSIHQNGSILAAMFASANLKMPRHPDFSMPVKEEWLARWRLYLKQECAKRKLKVTKPILVYRPIVLNTKWTSTARAPDPIAYNEIYKTIRDKFFVVSIADLKDLPNGDREWIVGPHPDADLYLHSGQLDFGAMCGLYRDAAMAFTNPGFSPVLAHAIGTPVVIVYGGNETFATTNSVGAHLAPTCAVDTDKPCPCHLQHHNCKKTITLPPAKKKVLEFTNSVLNGDVNKMGIKEIANSVLGRNTEELDKAQFGKVLHERPRPRVLIFGTMYCDTQERADLTRLWYELHEKLNPGCDLLLVDSASPVFPNLGTDCLMEEGTAGQMTVYETKGKRAIRVYQFKDNIGHLSRNGPQGPKSLGRDGWGRAFCWGLDYAQGERNPSPALPNGGYDYVVHIEGDSLFKNPVLPIIERMREEGQSVLTVPVKGTKNEEKNWVETGLMFFDVEYLRRSGFTKRYDWPNRQPHPTPERVIHTMLMVDNALTLKSWPALRGDKNQITDANVKHLSWVTHLRKNDGTDNIPLYRQYVEHAITSSLPGGDPQSSPSDSPHRSDSAEKVATGPAGAHPPGQPAGPVLLNFGCGTNKLPGWQNFDHEIDINRKLPFPDNHANFIFAEHVVEHTNYYKAVDFFKECYRVLKPGGVLRITTPSLERIYKHADAEYFKFTHDRKWAPSNDKRGAMHAILYCHGHQTAWTAALLEATVYYCGFDDLAVCETGASKHPQLQDVEGHQKVIGAKFNWIESISVEGTKR